MSDKNNLTNPIAILPQNLKAEIQQSFIYAISPSAKVEEFPDGKILITITDKLGTTQAQLYKYEDLMAARDEAVASAAAAKISEDNASASEINAQTYAANANSSLQNVIELERKVETSENNVQTLTNNTIQAAQAASNDADRAERAAASASADAEIALNSKEIAVSAKNDTINAKDITVEAKETTVNAKNIAIDQARNSEAWAVGQRNGVNVQSIDVAYHNNAKYYAERAGIAKNDAEYAKQLANTFSTSAQTYAANAMRDANRAEQAAGQSGYMFFYINSNGDLIYERTNNVDVDFKLIDGDLILKEVV